MAGVILAGGSGRRLGGALKATIRIGGRRLIERVAEALGTGVSPLLVAVGRHAPELLSLPPGVIAIADPPGPQAGPLGGIAAAAEWLAREAGAPPLLLSVAVDTPFLPHDFAARMLANLDAQTDVVVAAHAGQAYPTNALWRLEALRGLPIGPGGPGRGGPKDLVARLRHRVLTWPPGPDGDPFANLNTPEDRAALEARAARRSRIHDGRSEPLIGVGKEGQTR